jgi:hypothetical protein
VCPYHPPVWVSQNDTCNSYWVHHFSYFKIWDPYCFNGAAWASWPVDCIYNLSSGWKDYHIWLLAGYKQRRVQGFWKLSAIVSENTYSFMHSTYVSNLSLTPVVSCSTYKYLKDPDCYDQRSEKKKQKYGTKLCVRWPFPVCIKNHVLLHRACYLYVLMIMSYIYRACSATNNLKA